MLNTVTIQDAHKNIKTLDTRLTFIETQNAIQAQKALNGTFTLQVVGPNGEIQNMKVNVVNGVINNV